MRSNQRITSDASASLNLHHTENFATAAAHANSDTCSFILLGKSERKGQQPMMQTLAVKQGILLHIC